MQPLTFVFAPKLDSCLTKVCPVPSGEVWLLQTKHCVCERIHGEAHGCRNTEQLFGCSCVCTSLGHFFLHFPCNITCLSKSIFFFTKRPIIFSRSNCVICLCPDKRTVISEAYKVLKVRYFYHIRTDSFPSLLYLCRKKFYKIVHFANTVSYVNDLIS